MPTHIIQVYCWILTDSWSVNDFLLSKNFTFGNLQVRENAISLRKSTAHLRRKHCTVWNKSHHHLKYKGVETERRVDHIKCEVRELSRDLSIEYFAVERALHPGGFPLFVEHMFAFLRKIFFIKKNYNHTKKKS